MFNDVQRSTELLPQVRNSMKGVRNLTEEKAKGSKRLIIVMLPQRKRRVTIASLRNRFGQLSLGSSSRCFNLLLIFRLEFGTSCRAAWTVWLTCPRPSTQSSSYSTSGMLRCSFLSLPDSSLFLLRLLLLSPFFQRFEAIARGGLDAELNVIVCAQGH